MSSDREYAQEVFDRAFKIARTPRSDAYKAGCMAALRSRLDGAEFTPCPHAPGSAEFDAWHSGVDEARELSPIAGDFLAVQLPMITRWRA